jgi:hypothetical protein
LPNLIAQAQADLAHEALYCWIEQHFGVKDLSSYLIRDGHFFERVGYQETLWTEIANKIGAQPKMAWTDFSIVRTFDVTTCHQGLDADALLNVCAAMLPVYRLWRKP